MRRRITSVALRSSLAAFFLAGLASAQPIFQGSGQTPTQMQSMAVPAGADVAQAYAAQLAGQSSYVNYMSAYSYAAATSALTSSATTATTPAPGATMTPATPVLSPAEQAAYLYRNGARASTVPSGSDYYANGARSLTVPQQSDAYANGARVATIPRESDTSSAAALASTMPAAPTGTAPSAQPAASAAPSASSSVAPPGGSAEGTALPVPGAPSALTSPAAPTSTASDAQLPAADVAAPSSLTGAQPLTDSQPTTDVAAQGKALVPVSATESRLGESTASAANSAHEASSAIDTFVGAVRTSAIIVIAIAFFSALTAYVIALNFRTRRRARPGHG
jgi:hypothetical protein